MRRRAGRHPTRAESQELALVAAKADAAWADAEALSKAAGYPHWGRDGQRQNSEADGRSMVTCVLQRYALSRGLAYDGPQPQRGGDSPWGGASRAC